MKKNEIKHDPVREFILDKISKVKDRKQSFFVLVVGVLVLVSVTLNIYTKDPDVDYSVCILSNISEDIVSIGDYCSSESTLNSISDNNSINSNIGISVFINELRSMSPDQQIKKFEETDLSQIQNKLVRSKFYEFFADILMNSNRGGSKEHYLKAIELSDSDFHSAVLKLKLSKSLFLNNNLELAEKYIEEAQEYRFKDSNIDKEIDILKGRLNQAKRRL